MQIAGLEELGKYIYYSDARPGEASQHIALGYLDLGVK
jgi:hypothetical protein